jgi:hypothetical protein
VLHPLRVVRAGQDESKRHDRAEQVDDSEGEAQQQDLHLMPPRSVVVSGGAARAAWTERCHRIVGNTSSCVGEVEATG